MSGIEWLNWARGPGLEWAIFIFIAGMTVRLIELVFTGRGRDLAKPRNGGVMGGITTIVTRSKPSPGELRHLGIVVIGGWTFHLGFLITLLLFGPHIQFFYSLVGLRWPGLSNYAIDIITLVTIVALFAVLVHRLVDPVRRFLSRWTDYYAWLVTALPVVTGYLAFHRIGLPYNEMLAIHILSAELLLISIPFTKLIHMVTLFTSRYFNGAMAARKGVKA